MDFLKKHLEWFVSAAVGLVVCALVIGFEAENYESPGVLRMLCDGTFVAGILLAGFGGLVLVSAGGAFDAMGFAVHTLLRKFSPRKDRFNSRMTYVEFVERRREKKRKDPRCILLTGLVFLVAAVLFLVLYDAGRS